MTLENWQRVKELLDQAMALAPGQRADFLDVECGSDEDLRAELNTLPLVGDDLSDEFLNSPLRGVLDREMGEIDSAGELAVGQIFAQRFELIRKLGEGGMGQVWLAEQISPVRRQVALKLIKAGMYDEAVGQRFQSERQSLAMMDHPAIAKVFDAGTTPQGQPYLVMEYVPGLPITDYCDQHKLSIKDRLELFIHTCEGVQHAHQKAIIHRDLKPSNILVIEVDGKPTPRIIDFGLAKTTAPQVAGEGPFTQYGQFIGTPGFMSPEQVNLSARDIDTRTDVYSLGVVLYVLLTGLQPFETKRREKPSIEEWLRQLREEEPPNPSAKISNDREASTATAEARGTEPRQLASLLRGDLDWITIKALERDRTRRYGTPTELAADLRRYLDHQPVVARPASAGYRLRKYMRRHRVAVGFGAGLVVLFGVFSGMQTLQLRETTQQRDRANQERDRATRITDFMTAMFKVSDPREARGNSVTAREILDKASDDIEKGLARDPEVQSQMMYVMASTYTNLGLYSRAQGLAQRSLDARSNLHGLDHPKTLESMAQLGMILQNEGRDLDAEKLEREALVRERRILGTDDPRTLETVDRLGVTLRTLGHLSESEQLAREAVAVGTRSLGAESAFAVRSTDHLGTVLFYEGRYSDSEAVSRQSLDMARRVWGPDYPETLTAYNNLATAVHLQGRLAEAEGMYREILASSERVYGAENRYTAMSIGNLGAILLKEGHLAESEKFDRKALTILSQTLGPDHVNTLIIKLNVAEVLRRENQLQEAERMQREVVTSIVRIHGPEYAEALSAQTDLAQTLIQERRYAEAEKLARETFEIQLRNLGPRHSDVIQALQQLGTAMAYSHRYAEATKLFRDVIEKGSNPAAQGDRWWAWYGFACVAAAANHPDDALQYLREAVTLGYHDADGLVADDDLKNLHSNHQFQQLVAELKRPPPPVTAK